MISVLTPVLPLLATCYIHCRTFSPSDSVSCVDRWSPTIFSRKTPPTQLRLPRVHTTTTRVAGYLSKGMIPRTFTSIRLQWRRVRVTEDALREMESLSDDSVELEPYRTMIHSLCHIRQQTRWLSGRFTFDNSIADVCSEAEGSIAPARCMARTTGHIQRLFHSMFESHPFISFTDQRAFKWMTSLKRFALGIFIPQDHSQAARKIAFCWPSLCQRLQNCFHICRAEMVSEHPRSVSNTQPRCRISN